MTTKLTLSIDDAVVDSAKKYAQTNGRSLSNVVENYLKTLSAHPKKEPTLSPKVLKMMGVIKLPKDFDYKTTIGNELAKKYLK